MTYLYIYDVLALDKSQLNEYIDHVYPIQFETKDIADEIMVMVFKDTFNNIADSLNSSSYLDIDSAMDNEGRLRFKLYDKRGDFNFELCEFPNSYAATSHHMKNMYHS